MKRLILLFLALSLMPFLVYSQENDYKLLSKNFYLNHLKYKDAYSQFRQVKKNEINISAEKRWDLILKVYETLQNCLNSVGNEYDFIKLLNLEENQLIWTDIDMGELLKNELREMDDRFDCDLYNHFFYLKRMEFFNNKINKTFYLKTSFLNNVSNTELRTVFYFKDLSIYSPIEIFWICYFLGYSEIESEDIQLDKIDITKVIMKLKKENFFPFEEISLAFQDLINK